MGFDQRVDREGNITSCRDLLRFQALFSKHFALSPIRRFGQEGEQTTRRALRRYGQFRGGFIKKQMQKKGIPLTARSLIENWDAAEYHLLTELGTGASEGSDRSVTVTVRETPEWSYWRGQEGCLELARLFYDEVLPAMAEAVGAGVSFDSSTLDLQGPWSVTWTVSSAPDGPSSPVDSRIFDRSEEATEMARRTSMNNGALYYFCADEEAKRFDMAGEAALREAVRALAIERADAQVAAHKAEGWDLNVKTLMEHWDGQLVSIWQFAPGVLTEGTWHQDCTWCPYAAVWSEFGQRALDLGYLYDYELHPTYYRRYNPDMIVQFEAIKSRGDAMCKFRISLPSKQKPGEPQFVGYTGKDV